ncbi:MAG: hypothetical protein MI922_30300, partial [Bacteroidales bacterium]|nr:hypothetical protein [Bacteroidales bacterium]
MFEDAKDATSRFVYAATGVLLIDSPRRTSYGILVGCLLGVVKTIFDWLKITFPPLNLFECIVVGIFCLHTRTIVETTFRRRNIGEEYEELFKVIKLAEKQGLSKAHTKIQLLEVCKRALK